jgi:transcriptional regulator with XRE-family HTH domain
MKITGAQIRAARGFLKWSVSKLADAADVGISTVERIEGSDGDASIESSLAWRSEARSAALTKVVSALENAGITFLPANAQGAGVRGKFD